MQRLEEGEIAGRGALLRVDASKTEVLLDDDAEVVPAGFLPGEIPRVLVLDEAEVAPEELAGAPLDLVEELGNDDVGGVYFRPCAEVRSPFVRLLCVDEGPWRIVEPYNLRLLNTPLLRARAAAMDAEAAAQASALGPAQSVPLFDLAALAEAAPATAVVPAVASAVADTDPVELVAPGIVEARLLRDVPDLVGALVAPPTTAAVELVAYLATHQHRATTARLRDALGTVHQDASRAGSTVWAAAGGVRRCLGPALFPIATGNQHYVLSESVTCDWNRFRALVALGRTSADRGLERRALGAAIALVEGIPAAASRRFAWLEEEGFLEVIREEVGDAAERLAELELDALQDGRGSLDTVKAALDAGQLLRPHDERWRSLGARLYARPTSAVATSRPDSRPDSRSASRSI